MSACSIWTSGRNGAGARAASRSAAWRRSTLRTRGRFNGIGFGNVARTRLCEGPRRRATPRLNMAQTVLGKLVGGALAMLK